MTSVHGEVSVNWFDNVCVSTLSGAFNEEGISNWFLLLQQSWTELGKPERWAHVLDMYGWQGRTPECEALMREAVAWSMTHGLRFRVLLLERGPENIYFKLTQKANPIIPPGSNMVVCDSYAAAVEQLQQHGFPVTLQQLKT